MGQYLEEQPDQTAFELLIEFQARYPGRYSQRQLRTLQKRVRAWRRQAVQRLIAENSNLPAYDSARPNGHPAVDNSNIPDEAFGNKIT